MLKLKNVSKFYYSNGVISSGFSKVNLDLNIGEFVVITGESGSGKSTLLNVLSGLDSYEEGEMYINGEETSHYNEADFERYRRTYVGNIFQNFNLVNSYTVYQNVELALILNGEKKKDAKAKVLDIIEKVGLSDYINTKCSKLSGGQKQRVAIARALAKDTPIIVADEPTGNLDSKSAEDIMRILSKISKDKLVIIVTHNLEHVEKYATRLIKMHDGKIIEDKHIHTSAERNVKDIKDAHIRTYKDITVGNRIRLGVRNAFNIPVKFILIFIVFLFISFAVLGTYSAFQKMKYEGSLLGVNNYFSDLSASRLIVNKVDGSAITEEEFANIEALDNVNRIVKEDVVIDAINGIVSDNDGSYFMGNFKTVDSFDGTLIAGRLPENAFEILLESYEGDNNIENRQEQILESEFYLENFNSKGDLIKDQPIKVVGIAASKNFMWNPNFYAGDEVLQALSQKLTSYKTTVKTLFNGMYYDSNSYSPEFCVTPSDLVPSGEAYVSKSLNDMVSNGNAVGKTMEISAKDIYFSDTITVKISKTYDKNNFKSLLKTDYSDDENGRIYINSQDYNSLMNKGTFQSSVYVDNAKKIDLTVNELESMGFNVLAMKDSLSGGNSDALQTITLFRTFVIGVLIVALFFISYFVIRIILKSRNAYYTTLRTLGASRKISKQLLDIELILIATLAYAAFMCLVSLVCAGVITDGYIVDLAENLNTSNYILIYVIIVAMSYLISHKFSRHLFKDSVMNTYREEA